jgi:hypothetical protein
MIAVLLTSKCLQIGTIDPTCCKINDVPGQLWVVDKQHPKKLMNAHNMTQDLLSGVAQPLHDQLLRFSKFQ